jgi:hypothetical protein
LEELFDFGERANWQRETCFTVPANRILTSSCSSMGRSRLLDKQRALERSAADGFQLHLRCDTGVLQLKRVAVDESAADAGRCHGPRLDRFQGTVSPSG